MQNSFGSQPVLMNNPERNVKQGYVVNLYNQQNKDIKIKSPWPT